jgi:hypothetical protein
MINDIMLSVIMLNVVAPIKAAYLTIAISLNIMYEFSKKSQNFVFLFSGLVLGQGPSWAVRAG